MKKRVLIALSSVLLGLVIQCNSPKLFKSKMKSEAKKELSIKEQIAKGAFLVDVRTKEEYETEGSIENAVNIPLYDVESRLNDFKEKPYIILFCKRGHRAGIAKTILEKHGINNVINGINEENINAELGIKNTKNTNDK